MSSCFRIFSVGMFLVLFSPFLGTSLLAGNFPPEAIASWKKRSDRIGAVKVGLSDSNGRKGSLIVSSYGDFAEWELKNGKGIVRTVRNNRYAFQVKKDEGLYSLSGIRRPNEEESFFEKLMNADLGIALPEMYPFETPILEFDSPVKFELISQELVNNMIQLNLRCKLQKHDFFVTGGVYTIILDPAKEYLVREERIEHPGRKTIVTVEYAVSAPFGNVASRKTIRSEFPGRPVSTQDYRIAPRELAAIDAAEFRLPFYGFPEPDELRPKPWSIPFYVWALVVGVVAIGGASYMRYRNQRQV